jgi:streptogramin lyase
LWFTYTYWGYRGDDPGALGMVTTSGSVTTYAPDNDVVSPQEIVTGPDGNLWFTDNQNNSVDETTTANPTQTIVYTLPSGADPYGIVSGPNNSLWFAEPGIGSLAEISTSGAITQFPLSSIAGAKPFDVTKGSDGNVWFTDIGTNSVGMITPSGVVNEYTPPTTKVKLFGVTNGPGGIWFTEFVTDPSSNIGFIPVSAPVTVTQVTSATTTATAATTSVPTAVKAPNTGFGSPEATSWTVMLAILSLPVAISAQLYFVGRHRNLKSTSSVK